MKQKRKFVTMDLDWKMLQYNCPRILFVLVLFLALTGCSGPSVRTEAEIMEDLQNHSSFYSAQPVEITNIEILKRQTDQDDKIDTVYATIEASNDSIQCSLSYELTYGLYDQGWILDNVARYDGEESSWSIVPLQAYPEELCNADILQMYCYGRWSNETEVLDYGAESSLESFNADENYSMCTFISSCYSEYPYLKESRQIKTTYVFDPTMGDWYFANADILDADMDWSNMYGTWNLSRGDYTCEMAVYEGDNGEVIFEGQYYTWRPGYWYSEKWYSFSLTYTIEDFLVNDCYSCEVGIFGSDFIKFNCNSGIESFYYQAGSPYNTDSFTPS